MRALIDDRVAAAPGIVGIGTARRMTVDVVVEVRTGAPDRALESYDQVTGASLSTAGAIVVGTLDREEGPLGLEVAAGTYRTSAYTSGLATISDRPVAGHPDRTRRAQAVRRRVPGRVQAVGTRITQNDAGPTVGR